MTPKYNLGDKVKATNFHPKRRELYEGLGVKLPEGIITGIHIYDCERATGVFYDINDGIIEFPEDCIESIT